MMMKNIGDLSVQIHKIPLSTINKKKKKLNLQNHTFMLIISVSSFLRNRQ